MANPEWFRASLGNPDALIASINESGLQVPVLVRKDLLVIDGARRIMAYVAMGHKEIPVVISDDWDTVIEHLIQTRKAEASGLPHQRMGWEDLDTLWRIAMIPLYQPKRVARGIETKKAKKEGTYEEPPAAHSINEDMGRAFSIEPFHVKGVRDIFACLRGIQEDRKPTKAQVKPLVDLIKAAEARNPHGSFEGLYGIRNILRAVSRGDMSFSEAADLIKEREERKHKPRNQVGEWEHRRRRQPATESDIVRNFCAVIEQYGEQAQRLTPGDDLDNNELAKQIRTAVNRFNALRRRLLENGADTQGEQE